METFVPKGKVRGFIMPDFIFNDTRLSLPAKTLYALLCNYAGERDHCWPSHKTLATKLGCSVSSIKTYLKHLVELKLIQASDSAAQTVRSCIYFLLRPDALSSSVCSQNLPTPQSNSAYKYNLKEIKTNTPLPPQEANPKTAQSMGCSREESYWAVNKAFEDCFSVYPKQEAKELARAVWHSLHRKNILPSLEALKEAILTAKSTTQWQKDYGRYIPLFSNYLRGHRWEDCLGNVQEKEALQQENQKRFAAFEAQIKKPEPAAEHLRSTFHSLSKKFTKGVHGAAFGLWALLYQKGQAPSLADIPTEPDTDFFLWLKDFKLKQQFLTQ